jgi:2-keto-4-pentenoate hydratase/2-oxohepta-3-ene-1,7-dioic acid hydratase in catechol pathway
MKLLSFRYGDKDSYGLVSGERVLDLGCHLEHPNLRSALAAGALPEIAALARREAADLALSKIEFLPVIPDAGKIICVGRNYLDHVNEGNNKPTEKPMLFSRFPSSHVGHREPLVRPFVSTHFDYEGELAVIIGKVARHVKAEQALDYVAGYTCFNDGSVRDWQKHTHQLLQGKTFWRSGAIGPWLVTADEISDPSKLSLTTRVNGEQVQHSTTNKMIFNVPFLIEYISTIIDLQPGDIIATGTPDGVGLHRKPQLFLRAGDTVEVDISGIGVLKNSVVDETRPD